jgi:hypothetical protein
MLQIVVQHQSVNVNLADSGLDHTLCDLVRPFIGPVSDNPHSIIRLLLDSLQPAVVNTFVESLLHH